MFPIVATAQTERFLDEVAVVARRPASEIGLTKTFVDSAALRSNISLSMADVLGFNSSLFVKSSGRATLSTVAFRGTAPSHTAVEWNGIPVNSPALGMTDFSLIPAYLVDRASLLHGASSIVAGSGGLGGAVDLSTSDSDIQQGLSLQYVQGAGSFSTFDEFLRAGYGSDRWGAQTRGVYSSSENDFSFVNKDKYVFEYDADGNIVGRRHPKERNRNGAYRDFHLLQQFYFNPSAADKLNLDIWFTRSNREIAPITVDYGERDFENRQRDCALRSAASWRRRGQGWNVNVRGGYVYTHTAYDYGLYLADGTLNRLTESRTDVNSFFADARADWNPLSALLISASVRAAENRVKTADHASLDGSLGYDERRADLSATLSLRWSATERLGLAATLRQEVIGSEVAAPSPAFFADYVIFRPLNLTARASVARNFRAPTLNDLYFKPGGNRDLRNEQGWTWDAGLSASAVGGAVEWTASATWFDSHIDDWILWLPTNKGFFSPRNVKSVHSFGVEAAVSAAMKPFSGGTLSISASYALTRSINNSPPLNEYDNSCGKQLPYVPRHTASGVVSLQWREWSLSYKICYYSKRFTMTSNEDSPSGSLPDYVMNCADIERRFSWRVLDMSVKVAVNNLFDADYQTIMSHPMPGINFEAFVSFTPKF